MKQKKYNQHTLSLNMDDYHVKFVFEKVAEQLKVSIQDVLSKSRQRDLVIAREVSTYICISIINKGKREDEGMKGWSLVANYLKCASHATAMNLYYTALDDLLTANGFKEKLDECMYIKDLQPPIKRDEFLITC